MANSPESASPENMSIPVNTGITSQLIGDRDRPVALFALNGGVVIWTNSYNLRFRIRVVTSIGTGALWGSNYFPPFASASHFFINEFFAAPASGLPFLPMAFSAQPDPARYARDSGSGLGAIRSAYGLLTQNPIPAPSVLLFTAKSR